MKISRRVMLSAGVMAPLMAGIGPVLAADIAPPASPAGAPTLDELLRRPELNDVDLSPDGSQLAVLREVTRDGKRRAFFELRRTDAVDVVASSVSLGDFDVEKIIWATNDRLLIRVRFDKDGKGVRTGVWYGDTFVPIPVTRLISVSLDGRSAALMFGNDDDRQGDFFDLAQIADMLPGDPAHIMMVSWDKERRVYALYSVEILTGKATIFERGMLNTFGWSLKDGTPVLRYDSSPRRRTISVYSRPLGEQTWTLVREIRKDESKKLATFGIIAASIQPGVMFAIHREEGEETKSLRYLNLADLSFGPPIYTRAGLDVDNVVLDQSGKLAAVVYTDDRYTFDWVDKTLAGHFTGLNAFFENERNIFPRVIDHQHHRMVLATTGPRDSGSYFYYDFDKRDLKPLGQRQPWLGEDRLAPMTAVRIKSRDGVTIPAYLTRPLATGPRPLVVMPHGGPELRDSYDWDVWGQALAAQGWLVLQPNFRGSGGYGESFITAGNRHWGDRMQEDVEDCVQHVIASGQADPRKIAIFGASYGGYAALMGAVRNPALYRCAVSVAGPSDLDGMLGYERQEGQDSLSYQFWKKTIGDPGADKAAIRAASPVFRAAEIAAPILLIHGSEDWIVEPRQSKLMANALRKAGKSFEYVELKGVGHHDWDNDTHRTVLDKTIAFIGKAFA